MKPNTRHAYKAFHIIAVMTTTMLANMASASAQSPDMIWQIQSMQQHAKPLSKQAPVSGRKTPQPDTNTGPTLNLQANLSLLKAQLSQAPALSLREAGHQGVLIDLPTPDGQFTQFQAFKSSVMQADLARKFPNIKTYKVFGLQRRELSGVLDIGPRGFHAMIKGQQQSYYIDPDLVAFRQKQEVPDSYYLFEGNTHNDFQCHVRHKNSGLEDRPKQDENSFFQNKTLQNKQNGASLRTYRIAVSTSGEYAAAVSSADTLTQEALAREQTQAAIVTAISRVNEIFQRDLAINLELVANNDQLIFLDAFEDPYANNANIDINIIQAEIDDIIGTENYDVGHLFTIEGGGLAFFRAACSNNKARGVTGVGAGAIETDYFYVDFVAHELGHQFGGNHTFNAISGTCGNGNRNSATAWEPGSGSTIMAYAGLCAPQNLQSFSDAYFHGGSIEEMLSFVDSEQGACFSEQTSSDNPPSVNAGINYSIPADTPFLLSATANDIDSDPLFYSWEQMDTGSSSNNLNQMQTDNGSRPLFRSYLPVNDAKRFFPNLDDVLDQATSIGETYPNTNRTLDFRVTVRSGDYGSDYDDMRVKVVDTGQAFAVNDPQGDSFHIRTSNLLVTWHQANTHKKPIKCSHVDVLFNQNNSANFEDYIPLINNTENDGEQLVSVPDITSSKARILVKCADNIFYNVNPAPFNIVGTNNTTVAVSVNKVTITEGNKGSSQLRFTLSRDGDLSIKSKIDYIIEGISDTPANKNDFANKQSLSGTITFVEGESEKNISVSVKGDKVFEFDEIFQLRITDPDNTLIAKGRASVLIINDDIAVEPNPEPTSSKGHLGGYCLMLLFTLGLRTYRIKKTSALIILISLSTALAACSPSQEKNQAPLHPQAQVLEKYQYAQPSSELRKNLEKNDSRFIAFGPKGKLIIPGLVDKDYQRALKHGYRVQEGMGDVIFSEQHMKLREQFYIYASEYNRLLAEHLFSED